MSFKRFNLNYCFWVKLTPLGWAQYKQVRERNLPDELHRPLSEYQQQVNEQGYFEMQAWRFLQTFGGEPSATGNAKKYYAMDILIKGDELFPAGK